MNPNFEGVKILGQEKIERDSLIRHIMLVAGLVAPVPTLYFLTSTKFGQLVKAMQEHCKDRPNITLADTRIMVGEYLTVVNSTSEDQEAVDLVNEPFARHSGFAWKRDNWRVG